MNTQTLDALKKQIVPASDQGHQGIIDVPIASRGIISLGDKVVLRTDSSSGIVFDDPSGSGYKITLSVPTLTADRTLALTNSSGTLSPSPAADAANAVVPSGGALVFEGATADAFETSITVEDPTVDRAWRIPNAASTDFVGLTTAQTLTNKTLTAPTITAPVITGAATIGAGAIITTPLFTDFTEVVTGTNVIAAAESGTVFFLNNATGFVSTLPAAAAGLRFTFINTLANTSGNHTIVTNASANIIKGNQNSVAGDAGDTGTGDDTINFVANNSLAGDKVELFCDGTSWFAYAISRVAAGMTFTTAS